MSNIKITIDGVEKEYEHYTPPFDINPKLYVLRNGQWYREVEPKQDYEIMSFKDIGWGKIYKFNHIHYTAHQEGHYSNEQMLAYVKKNLFTIHSVKRLSDGEVFTVGDGEKNIGEITRIYITSYNEIMINSNPDCRIYLANAVKVKQPTILLTTEDSVNITDGEQVLYFCNTNFATARMRAKNIGNESSNIFLSTSEARDEYILMNKPITVTLKVWLDSSLTAAEFFKSKQK